MNNSTLRALIEEHIDRYPDMEALDLYKLLFDAALGPGHRIIIPHLAQDALRFEASNLTLEARNDEEIVEILDAERGIARINLSSYLRSGGDLIHLHNAVVRSSEILHDDRDDFDAFLANALRALSKINLEDSEICINELRKILLEARNTAYRPPQHSEAYVEASEPAYRVVLLSEMDA